MPTPSPTTTRLQLDELDALLQRMLALPVHRVDDMEPPENSTTARVEGPNELPGPRSDFSRAGSSVDSHPDSSEWDPTAEQQPNAEDTFWSTAVVGGDDPAAARSLGPDEASDPLAGTDESDVADIAGMASGGWLEDFTERPVESPDAPPLEPAVNGVEDTRSPRAGEPVGLAVACLLGLNRSADRVFLVFGTAGRFLTRPSGRLLLGGSGMLLLALAAWIILGIEIRWNWFPGSIE